MATPTRTNTPDSEEERLAVANILEAVENHPLYDPEFAGLLLTRLRYARANARVVDAETGVHSDIDTKKAIEQLEGTMVWRSKAEPWRPCSACT